MNGKKAKALRKVVKGLVSQGLVTEGVTYSAKEYTRSYMTHGHDGSPVSVPYNVVTFKAERTSARGMYRQLKRATKVSKAA